MDSVHMRPTISYEQNYENCECSQVETVSRHRTKGLLLLETQQTSCHLGSAYCCAFTLREYTPLHINQCN